MKKLLVLCLLVAGAAYFFFTRSDTGSWRVTHESRRPYDPQAFADVQGSATLPEMKIHPNYFRPWCDSLWSIDIGHYPLERYYFEKDENGRKLSGNARERRIATCIRNIRDILINDFRNDTGSRPRMTHELFSKGLLGHNIKPWRDAFGKQIPGLADQPWPDPYPGYVKVRVYVMPETVDSRRYPYGACFIEISTGVLQQKTGFEPLILSKALDDYGDGWSPPPGWRDGTERDVPITDYRTRRRRVR